MLKKYLYISLTFCCLCFTTVGQNNNNIIDEIVWVVGDEPILKSEVETRIKDYQKTGEKIEGDPYCTIPEQIAVEKLYLHQAKIDSVIISNTEAYRYADMMLDFRVKQIGSIKRLESYFEKPYSVIKAEMRKMAKDKLTIEKMQREIVKDIKSTPSEIRRYFKRLSKDSIPFINTQVELQILIIEPQIAQKEIDRVKTKLRGFIDEVNNGKKQFSTLAVLYSEDGSAMRGGELGFKSKGELVPEFANLAFSLNQPNRSSKIVKTEMGYHIIQFIEKRGDQINCRHILLKPKPSEQESLQALQRLDSIRKIIAKKEISFDDAVMYFSTDKSTRNNGGNMANDKRGKQISQSRFRMEELPAPALVKTVSSLKEGDISKPFIMTNPKTNKKVCAILKLRKRIPGHKANVNEDFQVLKELVETIKKQQVLNEWITEKQKNTYVKVNNKWKNCDFKYKGWMINK